MYEQSQKDVSLHTLHTYYTLHTQNMLLIYQRHKPVVSLEKIFEGCRAGNTFLKSQWLKKDKNDYIELQCKAMLKKILHHSQTAHSSETTGSVGLWVDIQAIKSFSISCYCSGRIFLQQ